MSHTDHEFEYELGDRLFYVEGVITTPIGFTDEGEDDPGEPVVSFVKVTDITDCDSPKVVDLATFEVEYPSAKQALLDDAYDDAGADREDAQIRYMERGYHP